MNNFEMNTEYVFKQRSSWDTKKIYKYIYFKRLSKTFMSISFLTMFN